MHSSTKLITAILVRASNSFSVASSSVGKGVEREPINFGIARGKKPPGAKDRNRACVFFVSPGAKEPKRGDDQNKHEE